MRHPRILGFADFPLQLFVTVPAALRDMQTASPRSFPLHLPYEGKRQNDGPAERTVRKRRLSESRSTNATTDPIRAPSDVSNTVAELILLPDFTPAAAPEPVPSALPKIAAMLIAEVVPLPDYPSATTSRPVPFPLLTLTVAPLAELILLPDYPSATTSRPDPGHLKPVPRVKSR